MSGGYWDYAGSRRQGGRMKTCETCMYFKKVDAGESGELDHCRRYPPVILEDNPNYTSWPRVACEVDGCGEHKERDDDRP